MKSQFCRKCGHPIFLDTDTYCPYCGHRISGSKTVSKKARSIHFKHAGIKRMSALIVVWLSWVVIWYLCTAWGMGSYIPGLDIADLGPPQPTLWFADHTLGFLIWFGLTGLIMAWPLSRYDDDEILLGISYVGALIIGILNSWVIFLIFAAREWSLGGFLEALLGMIIAHIIFIGFITSIGMAIFGIGVVLIWAVVSAILLAIIDNLL